MPYLVDCKVNAPMSPQLVDAYIAQCKYCEQERKNGKVAIFSPYADFSGGVAILNVDSPEDAMGIVAQSPIFPFVKVEIQPLVTWQFADQLAQRMKAGMAARAA